MDGHSRPRRAGAAGVRSQQGFTLIELVVAMAVFVVVLLLSTALYVSALEESNGVRLRQNMLADANFAKYWLQEHLAQAETPLYDGDWRSVTVVDAGDEQCHQLALDPETNVLSARQAADCAQIEDASPTQIVDNVVNDESSPLFRYLDDAGEEVADVADAARVRVELLLDSEHDRAQPTSRTFTFTLDGVYLANQLAEGSVTTSQIADGAVTSQKIRAGSLTGSRFADGAIGPSKLNAAARGSFFVYPVMNNGSATWTASAVNTYISGPDSPFTRSGVALEDFCLSGKTLQARGYFLLKNGSTSSSLAVQPRLVHENASGGGLTAFAEGSALTLAPEAYGASASGWATVSCAAVGPRYYYPQARVTESGSVGLPFTVVGAWIQLRYS
jgi:prepilin-type N-terminal cleavage/methylation domain-containing protein